MIRAVMAHKPNRVLDVGCGKGEFIELLREEGIEVHGIDLRIPYEALELMIVGNARDLPYPDNNFDVVVSNDFFEHIAEEYIDKVYSEMQRVSKGPVIARISIKPKEGHLTIKPIKWWKKKLPGCQFIGKDWNND